MRFRFTLIAVVVAAVVLLAARTNGTRTTIPAQDAATAEPAEQTELPAAAFQAPAENSTLAETFLADCVAAMEAAGQTHTVLVLKGIDETGVQALFPEVTAHTLDGKTAYEVPQEQANLAETAGEITVVAAQVLETGTEDPVWMFLME